MVLSDFTDDEWNAFYPYDFIEAEIGQGNNRTPTAITANVEDREIMITADTDDLRLGPAEMDIRITKGYDTIILPGDGVFKFTIVKTITATGV